jgi:hypothetical protein
MRSILIRCYPARWRARYGDEFLAILEERPLGPYDVADILLGALDARLRSRGGGAASTSQGRGLPMSLRVGGIAAILGAVILTVSWFGTISGALPLDGGALVVLIFIGLAALLLALTILSAFQARALPRLVWTAFAFAAVGAIAYTIGMIALIGVNEGDVADDGRSLAAVAYVVGGVAAIVGFALFGIATFRSGVLSRPGAVLLAVGPALGALAWVLTFTVAWDLGAMVMLGAMVCFLAGWIVLGIAAIRLDRPATAVHPA